jgi:hypothetical protein
MVPELTATIRRMRRMAVKRFGNPRFRPVQFVLPAIAAIPFFASLGFNAVDQRTARPVKQTERPALVFDQYLVNLDEIRNSPRAEARFCFKNCGKSPATITDLKPSCGCLNPRLEKRAYQPGEICDFRLGVLTTREKAGPHEYELQIDYEDPAPRSVTVAFKFTLRREVAVRPSEMIFYQGGVNDAEQKVVVTDWRDKPFRVTAATCKSPLVKVQVGRPIDFPEGGRETTIAITVAA